MLLPIGDCEAWRGPGGNTEAILEERKLSNAYLSIFTNYFKFSILFLSITTYHLCITYHLCFFCALNMTF